MDPRSASFATHADAMLARSLARPQTVQGYHTLLGRAKSRMGAVPVKKITRAHVQEVLADARAEGLSPKTCANLLQVIRLVLRDADSHAADGIRMNVPDADVRPLSSLEVGKLRGLLEECPLDDAILALLGSGLRLGELERLRSQDWDGRQARVANSAAGATKSGRARLVDVASWARAAVSRVLENGVPPRRTLLRHLADRCRAAGIPAVRLHDLRHTRATLLLLSQAPVLYVSAQMGHHDPAFTMRVYGHLAAASPEDRARWADAC